MIDYRWSWQENLGDNAGKWVPYDAAENDKIEQKWKARDGNVFSFSSDRYLICPKRGIYLLFLYRKENQRKAPDGTIITYSVSLACPVESVDSSTGHQVRHNQAACKVLLIYLWQVITFNEDGGNLVHASSNSSVGAQMNNHTGWKR